MQVQKFKITVELKYVQQQSIFKELVDQWLKIDKLKVTADKTNFMNYETF